MMTATTRPTESTAVMNGSVPRTLFVGLELSRKTWKLALAIEPGVRARVRTMPAGALAQLLAELAKAKAHFGLPASAPVRSVYEAGRDGFWVHRWLTERAGVENQVLDAASIELSRRGRQAKTDRLDAEKLVSLAMRLAAGERPCRVVHVPSEAAEDARQLHRTIETLTAERTRLRNRIQGLLATVGVELALTKRFLNRLATAQVAWKAAPVPAGLQRRIGADWARLQQVEKQLAACRAERTTAIARGTSRVSEQARALSRLKGIAGGGWTLSAELYAWRAFQNGRQIGAVVGLAPTPYASGALRREVGISHAGRPSLRALAVQLAWGWLRHQPTSALTRWYHARFGEAGPRARRIGIVALARKLLIAFWRYLEFGVIPEGAEFKPAA